MNRSIVYGTEQIRSFDFLLSLRWALEALAQQMADTLGGASVSVVTGLAGSQTSPASLAINLAAGAIYQLATIDPTQDGSLPPSTDVYMAQGIAAAQQLTLVTSGMSAGQSQWVLIEAQFTFADVIAPGDPNGGVLPYFNAANPAQPLNGSGGSGQPQPTERQATIALKVVYGTPATSGSEVPPTPDSGYVPLFLIDLAQNQTQILTGQIIVAGPSVGLNVPNTYPQAPFLAGLIKQHHKGIAGQAPQIDLTAEVQNTLPLTNLPASNTVGLLPTIRLGAGAPSGTVAGNADDLYFDTTGLNLYVCTLTGSSSSAVWNVAVTTSGAAPTGAAGGDLGGSYPNPSVAKIAGMPVKASQTPTSGQFIVGSTDDPAQLTPASLSGDVTGSSGTPGQVTVVGVRGVPIKATGPTDQQVPTYVAANSDIEWQSPVPAIISESDASNTWSPISLNGAMQTLYSVGLTTPNVTGNYRLIIEWNAQITINAATTANGVLAQIVAGSQTFGYVSGNVNSNGDLRTEGLSGFCISPAFGPNTAITVQMQMEQVDGPGNLTAISGIPSYMKVYVVRSN